MLLSRIEMIEMITVRILLFSSLAFTIVHDASLSWRAYIGLMLRLGFRPGLGPKRQGSSSGVDLCPIRHGYFLNSWASLRAVVVV